MVKEKTKRVMETLHSHGIYTHLYKTVEDLIEDAMKRKTLFPDYVVDHATKIGHPGKPVLITQETVYDSKTRTSDTTYFVYTEETFNYLGKGWR